MRAPLALLALLVLPACGEPEPQVRVTVNGKTETFDVNAMREASERSQALASRPLTAADVERYITLMQEMKQKGNKPEDWTRSAQWMEFGTLAARIGSVYAALKLAPDSLDERMKADAAVVRPFMDRIEAASKSK